MNFITNEIFAGGLLVKNFSDPRAPTARILSAADPGYLLSHSGLISDNAVMWISTEEKHLIISNYGNRDHSKNNLISLDLKKVREVYGKYFRG